MATKLMNELSDVIGTVVIISPGEEYEVRRYAERETVSRVAFIRMKGDTFFASKDAVEASANVINEKHPGFSRCFLAQDKQINSSTFVLRVPGFTQKASEVLYQVLDDMAFINKEKNEVSFPFYWEPSDDVPMILLKCKEAYPSFPWFDFQRSIKQQLTLLHNFHEMTREHVVEALEWIIGTDNMT